MTLASSLQVVPDPLTARFEGLPRAHDGETAFTFRIVFSEAVSVTPEAMRNHALTVTADYTATDGTLTFASGEETLTLGLSNPSEGQVTDGEATGTIENTDPLPRALLARFGRATALQVMEQVEERLEVSRAAGFRGRFAGRELRRGMERDMGRNFLSRLQSTAVQGARDTTGVQSDLSSGELLRTGLGGGDVLMGSGFVLNRETGGGGSVSRWSRGRESRFSGRDGELSLDGGVRARARSRSAGPTSRGSTSLGLGRPSPLTIRRSRSIWNWHRPRAAFTSLASTPRGSGGGCREPSSRACGLPRRSIRR